MYPEMFTMGGMTKRDARLDLARVCFSKWRICVTALLHKQEVNLVKFKAL